jgi:hypothetical protein
MRLVAYNWRFRNLVSLIHFLVGAGCGLAVKAFFPVPSVVDWALVGLMIVALFVLFNYRLVFDHPYNESPRESKQS